MLCLDSEKRSARSKHGLSAYDDKPSEEVGQGLRGYRVVRDTVELLNLTIAAPELSDQVHETIMFTTARLRASPMR